MLMFKRITGFLKVNCMHVYTLENASIGVFCRCLCMYVMCMCVDNVCDVCLLVHACLHNGRGFTIHECE